MSTRKEVYRRDMKRYQERFHDCPDFCHQCPLMGGGIMPMCMGTIMADDDLDLSLCCCVPGDPNVAKAELADRARVWLLQLRDLRRYRRIERSRVKAIRELCAFMKTASEKDRANAWARVADMLASLVVETPMPPSDRAVNEMQAVIDRHVLRFTPKARA